MVARQGTDAALHPLAVDYLERLRRAGRRLPRSDRQELIAELRAHLAETTDPEMSDAEVLTVLEQLGDPDEIVEAERPGVVADDRRGVHEWAAIFLLLFGGFVFGIGWVIGLILLWSSRAWTTGEKLIGTFIVPGGIAAGLFALGFGTLAVSESCTGSLPGRAETCTGGPSTAVSVIWIAILAVTVIGPFVTAVYLARTAR